jgi:TolB protein
MTVKSNKWGIIAAGWFAFFTTSTNGADTGEQAALRAELSEIKYKIIFETDRDGNWELYTVNADGSEPRNLTRTPDQNELYPHCSSDGRKICFVVDEQKESAGEKQRVRNVYFMNIDGTGRTLVAENAADPCWNPEGSAIAYTSRKTSRYGITDYHTRGIFIYELRSRTTKQIPNRSIMHAYAVDWSPDGNWFVYTVHQAMGFGHAVVAMDTDGTRIRPLTPIGITGCRPDFSPDSKRLCWVKDDQHICITDFNVGEGHPSPAMRTLVGVDEKHEVYHPDWSPDAKYIAFSYGSGEEMYGGTGEWQICVIRSEGGPYVQITSSGCDKEPDWIPVP